MNNIYIYKNNFISLLNLIKLLINNNIKPNNIKDEYYNPTLLDNIITLTIENNELIINEYISNIGKNIFNIIYYVYLSNDLNKELVIFYFYKNALKYKNNILNMRNLKCVNYALKISKYVSRESHKFKGFTRFKELNNNVLYAEIEPTNNIIFLLSKHFKNRLKNEYWIINDKKRNIISLYNRNNFYILDGIDYKLINIKYSTNEELFQNLWKSFYKTIGIESRKNDRCRMNFMPKKYWKYIIEMDDVYEKSN